MSTDHFPWTDIYEGNVFPSGTFEFEVESLEDGESQGGKRMPKARFRCTAPAELKGMSYFENYVCGTDEDLQNFVPGSFGTKALKGLFKAAQVPKGTSFEELMKNSEGNKLLIQVNEFTQTKGDYAGRQENNIVAYYKIGEREVGLLGGGKRTTTQAKVKMPSAPPKAEAPAKKPSMITCTVCSQEIPVKDFGEHVASCTG